MAVTAPLHGRYVTVAKLLQQWYFLNRNHYRYRYRYRYRHRLKKCFNLISEFQKKQKVFDVHLKMIPLNE
jgi:hypothetical protein